MNYNKSLPIIISASSANLILTIYWFNLGIYSSGSRYYFYEKPNQELILGISLFFIFWALIFISLKFLKDKKLLKTESLFKLILFILIIDILRKISSYLPLSSLSGTEVILIMLIVVICFLKFYKLLNKIFTIFLIIFSPFIFLNLANIINYNFLLNWDNNKSLIKKKNYPDKKNKIVLIIFDELDNKFIKKNSYENFNSFINTSNYYFNTSAAGSGTISNIISILTGSELKKILPIYPGDYKFTNNDVYFKSQNKVISLSEYKNIFTTLNNKGYKVGVVGHYHRYCNIFYKFLNMCFETNDERFKIKNIGLKKYLAYSLTNFVPGNSKIKLFKNNNFSNYNLFDKPNLRIKNILILKKMIIELIDKNDFIFIHVPLPHTPWIYKDGKITSKNINQLDYSEKNYLNNLALTDIFLKDILDEMKKKGIYGNSSIIISSDHGWRKKQDYIKPLITNDIEDKNIFLALKNKNQTIGKKISKQMHIHDIFEMVNKISDN